MPSLTHVFVVGASGATSFEDALLAGGGDGFEAGSELHPNAIMQLLYTSGTTGEPKGVLHVSNALIGTAQTLAQRMEMGPGDVIFMPSPIAHQSGFMYGMMLSMMIGVPLLLMDVWKPATGARLMEKHRASFMFAATPFLGDLANLEDIATYDLDAFRLCVTAGAPIPPEVVAAARDKLGAIVVGAWGMTENGCVTTTDLSGHKLLESDGKALPGEEVRVVDDAGAVVPAGTPGNLQFRGAANFVGYLKRPEFYRFDDDGWFDTGDLARMDDEGYIRIEGRKKDIIIRGGENIPVVEIENALYRMAEIRDVAVVAMPDPRLIERARVRHPEARPDPEPGAREGVPRRRTNHQAILAGTARSRRRHAAHAKRQDPKVRAARPGARPRRRKRPLSLYGWTSLWDSFLGIAATIRMHHCYRAMQVASLYYSSYAIRILINGTSKAMWRTNRTGHRENSARTEGSGQGHKKHLGSGPSASAAGTAPGFSVQNHSPGRFLGINRPGWKTLAEGSSKHGPGETVRRFCLIR